VKRLELKSPEAGFTLIEVLVALAIVAIGMAAVLSTLTSSARTVVYMRDKTLANWVALNHIAEQRLLPNIPQLGNTEGDLEFAGQKYHWRQEVVQTAVQGMVRMDVHVRPADVKGDEKSGWYVTMSGIMGDAVGAPRGDMPLYGTGTQGPNGPNGNGGPGTGMPGGGQPLPPGQMKPPGSPGGPGNPSGSGTQ